MYKTLCLESGYAFRYVLSVSWVKDLVTVLEAILTTAWEITEFVWESTVRSIGSPLRNPSSGWISIEKSKSGFHWFPFYRSIGKSEKGFAKLFSWTVVFLLLSIRARARPLFLQTVFKILFRISQSNGKMKIQKQTSQPWNPFSDFAFDCKSEIRILKSYSRFPTRTHP